MNFLHHFFDGLEGSRGHTHTTAVDGHGLQIDVLATLGRDIGMASGISEVCFFTGELVNARHRDESRSRNQE